MSAVPLRKPESAPDRAYDIGESVDTLYRDEIVGIGFDTPFQGAKNQPWHRDFPSPPESYRDRRITSLAFNLTGVDVTPDMGPFEVAPGTQWDDGRTWKHEMFPPQELWPRYEERGVK